MNSSAMCQLIDPMLMIDPPPAFAISGWTACEAKKWWFRFNFSLSSQYSGVTSSGSWRWSFAALLISTRTAPKSFSICLTDFLRATMSVRSQFMNTGGKSSEVSLLASSCEASSRISINATLDPCLAKASTKEAPIPEPPPVISIVLSFKSG